MAIRQSPSVIIATALLVIFPALASNIAGQASVIDGDTIEIHGQRIRLWGIDAPETTQLCRGSDSELYRCGAVAANSLSAFIAGRSVVCASKDVDRYGRTVARCTVVGTDLGGWMVTKGHALDWPQYSKGTYATNQAFAQKAAAGMWAGSFAKPWMYRACMALGGSLLNCSDAD